MTYGQERLHQELVELGYDARKAEGNGEKFVIISNYTVPSGVFAGRVIELGFSAPADYPQSVASSLHVLSSPQFYPAFGTQGKQNICASNLGGEWRYWSINLSLGWTDQRYASRLISLANTVFDRA